jgi:hydrogenase expression/formation protein HypD
MKQALEIVQGYQGPTLRIMEVCGTHTHEIFRKGIRKVLPETIELISGPGCPVCVTPVDFIDEAILLATEHGCTICTFGDLVRVPGTRQSLASIRAQGADVRIVYSPMDALAYAKENPEKQVVFLSVGFETTIPACCLTVWQAKQEKVDNYSLLTANKTMPQAYRAMKDACELFLYPGHVHAITGTKICEQMKEEGISGVVAGFTTKELITALAVAVTRFQQGKPFFENCYPRIVKPEGNPAAVHLIHQVMEPCDALWRGIGEMKDSGMRLRSEYAAWDARLKYNLPKVEGKPNPVCRCGQVLQGQCKPTDCPVFGRGCTPEHPIGACMVSDEGACSAFYLYGGAL